MNMKFFYRTCIIQVLILFYSCNNPVIHELVHELDFKKTYYIEGEKILTEAVKINQLVLADEFLIASQYKGDYFFKVYDLETLAELGQVAKKGSGPNEFPTIVLFDQQSGCGNDVCIWVHDLNADNLVRINVSESIKNQTTIITKEVKKKLE